MSAKQNLPLPRSLQVLNRLVRRAGTTLPQTAMIGSGVHLLARHNWSLSSRAELDSMFAAYNLMEPSEVSATSADHDQLYARERRVLEGWRVLPLVTEAESVGLDPTLRDWMPRCRGEWDLADVWLELPDPAAADASSSASTDPLSSRQARAAAPGAKP
ncbi:MAG: hypothetical protein ACRD51_00625 [Candidatus Acidiferrum sp.]